jgi:hypothetical protein
MDLTWHSPSDPEQHPTLELRRDWDTSWGAARLSGGVPYLPHGALLDRTWNSRDVRRWVRAPLKQSHCTLLPLGALTAPHGTIASISRSVLSTPAIYRDSGQGEVLDQYGRSFRHTQKSGSPIVSPPAPSHLLTRVNVPVIDAIENGSIDLALRYGISVGFTPRLERLARHWHGRTQAAVCCRLRPVSAESDDRHGRAWRDTHVQSPRQ